MSKVWDPRCLVYLNAGYSAERLMEEIGHTVLWDDTGSEVSADTAHRV